MRSSPPEWQSLRDDLTALHGAALAAADPVAAVRRALRTEGERLLSGSHTVKLEQSSRVWLIAFGKASCGMARAAIEALGPRLTAGVVAHPHGIEPQADWPPAVRCFAAGHPLPDDGSLRAGEAALTMLRHARRGDVAVVLASGGGSALFESLRAGVTLADLRGVTEALQHAGADIMELNTVRRSLSRIKGGGLARASSPARVVTLLLSDVISDAIETIASGPTVDSSTGPQEALDVLERRCLAEPFPAVAAALREGVLAGASASPATERFTQVVASNRIAGSALCAEAEARGFRTLLLTDRLQGEAREAGRIVGGVARGMSEGQVPLPAPACVVLGGETTVTVRGNGRGGRNLELALGAALALDGCRHAAVFSFATDGVDGSSKAAGAVARGDTIARAKRLGLSAHAALTDNDTEPFFTALDDLWITGPSGTNVNDLVVALAYP